MSETATEEKQTKKDFVTENDVRWCPGCGDYSILNSVQKFLPTLNIPREKYVFVSGIGCSSRFPYYMNTYGFHTIHGRAPTVATGVKLANPDLSVWVITGDGDALSIGGNHLIHLLRRNVDLNVLLFNNRIYGLTKGQYSPTSEVGKVTKSTPVGSVDHPISPIVLALGAEATFVARTLDVDAKLTSEVLEQASKHKGTSFVEIYQNCNIFNDGAFKYMSERDVRAEQQVKLLDGEPLVFGKDNNKAIKLNGLEPEVIEVADTEDAIKKGAIIYKHGDINLASIISRMKTPEFPVPMGVFFQKERASFDELVVSQVEEAKKKVDTSQPVDERLSQLFGSGDTWDVA
jgi:2-oxoglutarate ferredoxin oxidoreductase subunit beta